MFSQQKKLDAGLTYYLMSGAMALFDSTMFVYLTIFYYSVVGLNPLQLVLVGTVLEASILVLEVPTGVVADTYSRRMSVILGVLILGAAFVLTGIARSFAVVLVAQVIAGLGYTFTSGATDAWLADEVGEENVGRIYLRSGQFNRVLGILGIAISGLLASFSLGLPIVVGGALYLLLGSLLIALMPEANFHPARAERASRGLPAMAATFREGTRVIRGKPVLIMLVAINFFVGTSSEGFDRLGDAHLLDNFTFPALGALQPVLWFSILGVAGSLFSLLVTELLRKRLERITTDRAQTARALTGLTLVGAGAALVFALAGSFPMAAAALLVRGATWSLGWPLHQAWAVQNITSRVRATVLSMTGQSNALGQIIGGPGVGWLGNTVSLRSALTVASLLLMPIAALYARAARNELPPQGESAAEIPPAEAASAAAKSAAVAD